MTPQQQIQAIAEACGWKSVGSTVAGVMGQHPDRGWMNEGVPDYLHDLNAIQQAITSKLTTKLQREGFMWNLSMIVHDDQWAYTLPTPEQWCEAFLRTIGKWVEETGKESNDRR